ncbi:MAG: hypothetical protein JNM43_27715 [Planctomycetaceae bacterium]|nr:hypothetical protein [Planctomycetaceae bacterium]
MEHNYPDEYRRLQEYATRKRIDLLNRLGWGMDGLVYSTKQSSAVKAHSKKETFEKEQRVYQALAEHPEYDFAGFSVPRMLECHPELWIIEMQLVVPPFVVDFTGATIGKQSSAFLDMSEEDYTEWRNEKIEAYGESDWEQVEIVIRCFRRIGIYLNDVHKGNIRLRNE